MRDFSCPRCGQRLAFENSVCLACGSNLAFDLDTRRFVTLTWAGVAENDPTRSRCANAAVAACNWLARPGVPLCVSCALTRTRPSDGDADGLAAFADAEGAKRRLVVELEELCLPIHGRDVDPVGGLAFDLLSSSFDPVTTGHADGLITLDLAEGDDVHREQLRVSMEEPYRTILGHFRHEIGHYYYGVLAESPEVRRRFEALFGDPDADYQAALDRHYAEGPPANWQESHISAYATMHPSEDWAETFAHYLHIRDTLDTAAAFSFAPSGATLSTPLEGDVGFDKIIELWLPLSWALNMINRSMGHTDLYPFMLPVPALDKMRLVHELVGCPRQESNLRPRD